MSLFKLDIYFNCAKCISEWEDILDYYGDEIDADEVWEYAKYSDKVPVMGNIYQNLVLGRILIRFCEDVGVHAVDCPYWIFVNSIDTHLRLYGVDVYSLDQYLLIVKAIKKRLKKERKKHY